MARGRKGSAKIRIPKGFTERKCMCCANPFPSESIHNRLCRPCKAGPRAAVNDYGLATASLRIR